MDLVYAASWLYSSPRDSQAGAEQFFQKLRHGLEQGHSLPFDAPCEKVILGGGLCEHRSPATDRQLPATRVCKCEIQQRAISAEIRHRRLACALMTVTGTKTVGNEG